MWFKEILKYKEVLIGIIFILLIIFSIKQCETKNKYKSELETKEKIFNQNLQALNDSTIQLQLTRDQLKIVDKSLSNALYLVDSLNNIKTQTITIIKPEYLIRDVSILNKLIYDSIQNKYGLNFNSIDLVRTIEGSSWFKIDRKDSILKILPDTTKINYFNLNFTLVVSQYEDNETKYIRTKITPFNVKSNGELGEVIPETMLKLNFRNAEILDKPFTPNINPINEKKIKTGFGLSISPLAFGFYPTSTGGYKFGWTPNIGISYNIIFFK